LRKNSFIAILAMLVLAVLPSGALAHATLIRSDPADNTVLTELPPEIRLWFSEAISPDFSSAQLLDINGQPMSGGGTRVNPAENLLILTPPPLPEGLYSVRWKVLSEADGHFTQGLLVFGLGAGVDLTNAAALETETTAPLPEVLLRWLNFTVLLTLVGGVAMAYLILRPTPGKDEAAVAEMRGAAHRRVMGLATICSGLAVVTGLGLLLWQMGTLAGDLPEGASMAGATWQLLSRTRWGLFWLLRQGILLVLSGVLGWYYRQIAGGQEGGGSHSWQQRLGVLGTGLLLLAVLTVQGLTGHAAALTLSTTLAVGIDALHLLAASFWVGGLLALSIGLLPLLRRQNRADFALLTRSSWGRFGGWAAISMGVLVATGLYNTGRQVISLDALLATLYGQALLTKMGLLVGIGLVGLCNSLLLHPGLAASLARWLGRPIGWTPLTLRQLPRLILLEVSLGLLALLATGIITATPPARSAEFALAADEIPTALDQTIDDMLVTFSARPNRPGQNVFMVRAVSVRRPPPAEIMRVILRFTFLEQEVGRTSVDAVEIEPGLYQVGGNYLSLAGAWQVEVVVRRRGIEDSVARFNWLVAPPGPPRPLLLSRQPLEPVLTIAAAITGLIPLVMAGVWWRRKRRATLAFTQAGSESTARGDSDDKIDDARIAAGQPRSQWLWEQSTASVNLQREYDA